MSSKHDDASEAASSASSPPSDTATNGTSTTCLPSGTTTWYIYPPPTNTPAILSLNDLIYIKSKSSKPGVRGRVVKHYFDEKRVDVILYLDEENERVVNVAIKRCIRIYPTITTTTTTILVTRDTHAYRHLAASQLSEKNNAVLEIGCSTGKTSHILLQTTNHWMGMDVSTQMLQEASVYLQSKGHALSESQLIKHDVLIDPSGAERSLIQHEFHPNVVFMDIGGNRDLPSAVRVLQWSLQTFSPKLVVIKNEQLVQTLQKDVSTTTNQNGMISGGHAWFQQYTTNMKLSGKTKWWPPHALQAPMVMSPMDGVTPICRYHNYHPSGCQKGINCPFCHFYCHWCRQPGHNATVCPLGNDTTTTTTTT